MLKQPSLFTAWSKAYTFPTVNNSACICMLLWKGVASYRVKYLPSDEVKCLTAPFFSSYDALLLLLPLLSGAPLPDRRLEYLETKTRIFLAEKVLTFRAGISPYYMYLEPELLYSLRTALASWDEERTGTTDVRQSHAAWLPSMRGIVAASFEGEKI